MNAPIPPVFRDTEVLTAEGLHHLRDYSLLLAAGAAAGDQWGFLAGVPGRGNHLSLENDRFVMSELAIRNRFGRTFFATELQAPELSDGRPELWLQQRPGQPAPTLEWWAPGSMPTPDAVLLATFRDGAWRVEAPVLRLDAIQGKGPKAREAADLLAAVDTAQAALSQFLHRTLELPPRVAGVHGAFLPVDAVYHAGEELAWALAPETPPLVVLHAIRLFSRRVLDLALSVVAVEDQRVGGQKSLRQVVHEMRGMLRGGGPSYLSPAYVCDALAIEFLPAGTGLDSMATSDLRKRLEEDLPRVLDVAGPASRCLNYRNSNQGPLPVAGRPFAFPDTLRLWRFEFGDQTSGAAIGLSCSARLNSGLTIFWTSNGSERVELHPGLPMANGRIPYPIGERRPDQRILHVLTPDWATETDLELL